MPYNPEDRGCATCQWARFPPELNGMGVCEIPEAPRPLSEMVSPYVRNHIWESFINCPTWAAPDGGEQK